MAIRTRSLASLALVAVMTTAAFATPGQSSAFQAWQVTDVPWGDILNVRKWPASHSQKQAGYPNGAILSMTGRCQGGLTLDQLAGLGEAQKRQAVRYRWCEIWHDPARDSNYVTGWIYMKYAKPAH